MPPKERSTGQVLVIFAVSLLALLFFVGLAVDAGSMYVTYGQLKRAVDSAALSASVTFKHGEGLASMTTAAREALQLQNVDMSSVDLQVHMCDENGDGVTDPGLQTTAPEFWARCPSAGQTARKLVWVKASAKSPFYFLSLLGFHTLTLSSYSIAEAAPVDLVIVLDVSESMGDQSSSYVSTEDFQPNISCNPHSLDRSNSTDACQPLWDAKNAASLLIGNSLYQGYDRVSAITFDSQARVVFDLTDKLTPASDPVNHQDAQDRLWSGVLLHDDPDYRHIWPKWLDIYHWNPTLNKYDYKLRDFLFNPVNPDDRDGDGKDYDDPAKLGYSCPDPSTMDALTYKNIMADRWWDYNPTNDPSKDIPGSPSDPYHWGGVPCDDDTRLDGYDWNGDGVYSQADTDLATAYYNYYIPYYNPSGADIIHPSLSILSTCTGCGLRMGSNEFKNNGRPGAVWVMVFLSDGAANLSDTSGGGGTFHLGDTPDTQGGLPASYPSGFCRPPMPYLDHTWWQGLSHDWCEDSDLSTRYCMYVNDTNPLHKHYADCPSTSEKILDTDTAKIPLYSVVDYAMDVADSAVKQNQMAIYTIGLNVVGNSSAEKLLRYIAWVGDGSPATDPCASAAANTTCGQYYFATQNDLNRIFDDIATRIYTKLSE